MQIVQLIFHDASFFERKSQEIDRAILAAKHDVTSWRIDDAFAGFRDGGSLPHRALFLELHRSRADLAHVYGSARAHGRFFGNFPLPYVASDAPSGRRLRWRQPRNPLAITTPIGPSRIPESVEPRYFAIEPRPERASRDHFLIGTYGGARAIRSMVDRTLARISRFRDDLDWKIFDHVPIPEELTSVDLWVDPTADENDFDGLVAEALVVGQRIVASRTAINLERSSNGEAGRLVPPNDPNEMTHAILTALFKPEVSTPRLSQQEAIRRRFSARNRERRLFAFYGDLLK